MISTFFLEFSPVEEYVQLLALGFAGHSSGLAGRRF
jgi:hypothetical protein